MNLDCLKRLIQSQANIWLRNQRGDYPIHEAISKSNLASLSLDDFVRYIFQLYPSSINIRNSDSRTALHLAASLGSISLCRTLLSCGARINCLFQTLAVSTRFVLDKHGNGFQKHPVGRATTSPRMISPVFAVIRHVRILFSLSTVGSEEIS